MLKEIFSKRMLTNFLMGFSSGLPLLLTGATLKAWMTEAHIDLTVIGFFSLVGLPYTLKFLWAPLLDRITLPFLGRRRGWLLVAQLLLLIAIFYLSTLNPELSIEAIAVGAFLVSFWSATQDIIVDAYRRESLTNEELGLGSSLFVNGYRVALLFSGAGALALADQVPWDMVYKIMALGMGVGLLTTIFSDEPKVEVPPPRSMKDAFVEPLVEFFKRKGALSILAFILLYKIGDSMASDMTNPFYLGLGFSKTEIGTVAKLFGFWATIVGSLIGGVLILKIGIYRALWIFGILQSLTTLGFSWLAHIGPSVPSLAVVITAENLAGGMGTSAFMAYMAAQTNKRFTATQYALLSSLMGVPRVIASAPTGWMAKNLGWDVFFLVCTLIAIPGLMLLAYIQKMDNKSKL